MSTQAVPVSCPPSPAMQHANSTPKKLKSRKHSNMHSDTDVPTPSEASVPSTKASTRELSSRQPSGRDQTTALTSGDEYSDLNQNFANTLKRTLDRNGTNKEKRVDDDSTTSGPETDEFTKTLLRYSDDTSSSTSSSKLSTKRISTSTDNDQLKNYSTEATSQFKKHIQAVPETGGNLPFAESGNACFYHATLDYYRILIGYPMVLLTGLFEIWYETLFYFEKDQPAYFSECLIATVKLIFFPIGPFALALLCRFFLYNTDADQTADIVSQGWGSFLSIQIRRELICTLDAAVRVYKRGKNCAQHEKLIALHMWDKEWWHFLYLRNAAGVPRFHGRCGGKLNPMETIFEGDENNENDVHVSGKNTSENELSELTLRNTKKNGLFQEDITGLKNIFDKISISSDAELDCSSRKENVVVSTGVNSLDSSNQPSSSTVNNFILKARMSFHGRGHIVVRPFQNENKTKARENSESKSTASKIRDDKKSYENESSNASISYPSSPSAFCLRPLGSKENKYVFNKKEDLYRHLNNAIPAHYLMYEFVDPLGFLGTHSLRITTFRLSEGAEPEVVYSYFTHSQGDTTADTEAGNEPTYHEIDWKDSKVGPYISECQLADEEEGLTGTPLPGLQEAAEVACRIHAVLPHSHAFFGHDIVLTANGPVFFETNAVCEGFSCMQNWRPELGTGVAKAYAEYCVSSARNDVRNPDWKTLVGLEEEGNSSGKSDS